MDLLHRALEQVGNLLWLVLFAMWGGTVSYISRIKTGEVPNPNLLGFLGEMLISGFVGLLSMYICSELTLSWQTTAVVVGISGHMGARLIPFAEGWILKRMGFAKTCNNENQNNGKDNSTL